MGVFELSYWFQKQLLPITGMNFPPFMEKLNSLTERRESFGRREK